MLKLGVIICMVAASGSALACDMHGAGGFHAAFGTSFTPYNPNDFRPQSYSDDFSIDSAKNSLTLEGDIDINRAAFENIKAKPKPTFSTVALRASSRAKAKVSDNKTATLDSQATQSSKITPRASKTDG